MVTRGAAAVAGRDSRPALAGAGSLGGRGGRLASAAAAETGRAEARKARVICSGRNSFEECVNVAPDPAAGA